MDIGFLMLAIRYAEPQHTCRRPSLLELSKSPRLAAILKRAPDTNFLISVAQ